MTYPDGEVLTYGYNTGGLLNSLTSNRFSYITAIAYDLFEQRTSISYGNGVVTNYAYSDTTRNLKTISVMKNTQTYMNNSYGYDAVNNVVGISNSAAFLPRKGASFAVNHRYVYDDLYRLTSATGAVEATGNPSIKATYSLSMTYDNLHNITGKVQTLNQTGVQFPGTLKSGYDLKYAYEHNPQQISSIEDSSYRTVDAVSKVGKSQRYRYDANGNLLGVSTVQKDGNGALSTVNQRSLLWDEENRLLSVNDNGYVSNYWYDASGERTLKISGQSEGVFVNGLLSGGRTDQNFTAYVSPYVVVSNGGRLSKHIYAGSQRIASVQTYLANDPRDIEYAYSASGVTNYPAQYAIQVAALRARYDSLGVAYLNSDNRNQPNTLTPSSGNITSSTYFYHPDHLGSSSMVTDGTGSVTQHLEYLPFGEVFLDDRQSTSWNTPYKFNAKELDEETGLYYYGARYYDPRTSVWLSVDPLAEKYPNVSSYVYCMNNPVRYVDPDGRDWVEDKNGDVTWNKNVTSVDNTPEGYQYRGTTFQREKVWTNQLVNGNSESGLMCENYNPDGKMTYNNLTPWIDAAFEELGTARFEGSASNPRIEEYLSYTQLTGAAINDATSWCAGFANYALENGGVDGTNSSMALSFRNWGEDLDSPAYGSVATISYGGGKGHVGFVVGVNNSGQLLILGGNQGSAKKGGQNEVNISPNSASSFKFNYPSGYKQSFKLPMLNIKGKSISYGNTR